MNEDLEQQRGEASEPPAVPDWFTAPVPVGLHRAAHAAWVHRPTDSVLLRLWYWCTLTAGSGQWVIELRHPSGRSRVIAKSNGLQPPAEADLFGPAESVIAEIENEMQQGG